MREELVGLPEPMWFHHGEAVLALVEKAKPLVSVELGAYRGCSAIALGRLVKTWGGKLTTIDLWDNDVPMDECRKNIVDADLAGHVELLQGNTNLSASTWATPVDFLYVDGDHSFNGCLADLEAWWPHVRVGGLVCGDDYGRKEMNVTEAWDEFSKRTETHLHYIETPGVDGMLVYAVKQ